MNPTDLIEYMTPPTAPWYFSAWRTAAAQYAPAVFAVLLKTTRYHQQEAIWLRLYVIAYWQYITQPAPMIVVPA